MGMSERRSDALGGITMCELYWIAGFLEGEGCFFWTKKTFKHYVAANQVQREPLDRLRAILGGSICWSTRIHSWKLCGPMAAGLMMTLYPLLSPRRKAQVAGVLAEWKKRPGRSFPTTHCQQRHLKEVTRRGARVCRVCARERSVRFRAKRALLVKGEGHVA